MCFFFCFCVDKSILINIKVELFHVHTNILKRKEDEKKQILKHIKKSSKVYD